MQIDFHHAVTYVLARLAGFAHQDATIIAYASQYVDNSTNQGTIRFDNGETYQHIASAHEVFDFDHNVQNNDDYLVWVPFHFLPGNNGAQAEGATIVPLYQRLQCTPDSPLAADMWKSCRASIHQPNSLHRLGITAHVYADTFSHQMFAGMKHKVNIVTGLQHIDPAEVSLLDKLEGVGADLLMLGHGGASTDPDLPYLKWNYKNGFGQLKLRDNRSAYLLACDRLFFQFACYLGRSPELQIDKQDRAVIQEAIHSISNHNPAVRHKEWLDRIHAGQFTFGALSEQEIGDLNYAAKGVGSWKFQALGTTDAVDLPGKQFHYVQEFETCNWKRFHDALKEHQNAVLNEIMPYYHLPSSYAQAKEWGLD